MDAVSDPFVVLAHNGADLVHGEPAGAVAAVEAEAFESDCDGVDRAFHHLGDADWAVVRGEFAEGVVFVVRPRASVGAFGDAHLGDLGGDCEGTDAEGGCDCVAGLVGALV